MGSTASVANICTISSPPPPRTTSFISPAEMYNPAQKEMVRLKFSGKNLADLDTFSKSDPFLELSRPSRQGYNYTSVRKTETINNNLNPNWKILYISLSELCDRDFDMKLKIEVFDEDNTTVELIGDVSLSLNDMLSMAASGTQAPLFMGHKRDKHRGDLYVKECVVENYSHKSTQDVTRRSSLMSQSESMLSQEASRRCSLMTQSEYMSSHQEASRKSSYPFLNNSSPSFPGTYPNNNQTIPPAANYNNPAASLGYPPQPTHPGYSSSPGQPTHPGYPPTSSPGYPPSYPPTNYPPSHQGFQPPGFPAINEEPPAYPLPLPVPSHDQHNIPSYNFQQMEPPGQNVSYPPLPFP